MKNNLHKGLFCLSLLLIGTPCLLEAKIPATTFGNCRQSIDPDISIDGTLLTSDSATEFLVACLLGGQKNIGTIDITYGMAELTPAQKKALQDKKLIITELDNGDIGISSNQAALDKLVAAYKMPMGDLRDKAIGNALIFTTFKTQKELEKEMTLKKSANFIVSN